MTKIRTTIAIPRRGRRRTSRTRWCSGQGRGRTVAGSRRGPGAVEPALLGHDQRGGDDRDDQHHRRLEVACAAVAARTSRWRGRAAPRLRPRRQGAAARVSASRGCSVSREGLRLGQRQHRCDVGADRLEEDEREVHHAADAELQVQRPAGDGVDAEVDEQRDRSSGSRCSYGDLRRASGPGRTAGPQAAAAARGPGSRTRRRP